MLSVEKKSIIMAETNAGALIVIILVILIIIAIIWAIWYFAARPGCNIFKSCPPGFICNNGNCISANTAANLVTNQPINQPINNVLNPLSPLADAVQTPRRALVITNPEPVVDTLNPLNAVVEGRVGAPKTGGRRIQTIKGQKTM